VPPSFGSGLYLAAEGDHLVAVALRFGLPVGFLRAFLGNEELPVSPERIGAARHVYLPISAVAGPPTFGAASTVGGYITREWDTLQAIARLFRLPLDTILALPENVRGGLRFGPLNPGQVVYVPLTAFTGITERITPGPSAPESPPADETPPPGIPASPPSPILQSILATIQGELRTPPGGLPLTGDWDAIGRAFAEAQTPTPDAQAGADAILGAWIDELDQELFGGPAAGADWWTFFKEKVLRLNNRMAVNPAFAEAFRQSLPLTGSILNSMLGTAYSTDLGPKISAAVGLPSLKDGLDKLRRELEGFYTDAWSSLIGVLETGDPDDPADALRRAARATAIAFGAGFASHGVAVGLELIHPFKQVGFGQLAAYIADMAAFSPLVRAQWTHAIEAAITRPLEHLYNTRFPTRIPPFGEVLAMARKHEYDADPAVNDLGVRRGFADDMLKLGIPRKWVDRFWLYMWADPRLYDLIRIADVAPPPLRPRPEDVPQLHHYAIDPGDPDWWWRLKFKKAGYDDTDLPILIAVAKARTTLTERTRLLGVLRGATVNGYLSRDFWAQRAAALGQPPDALDIESAEIGWRRFTEEADDLVAFYLKAHAADQISDDDLEAALAVIIAEDSVLARTLRGARLKHDLAVRQEESARLSRETAAVQREAAAAYRAQLRAGQITPELFRVALESVGYTPDLAGAVAQREAIKLSIREARTTATAAEREAAATRTVLAAVYEEQYALALIDDATLKAGLLAAGFSDGRAGAITARAQLRLLRQAQQEIARAQEKARQAADRAAAAAKREAAAEARRVAAEERRAAIDALRLEERRARDAERRQREEQRAAAQAERDRARAEKETALQEERRFRAESAERERYLQTLQAAAQAAYIERFRRRLINAAQLQRALDLIGIDPALAGQIIDRERARLGDVGDLPVAVLEAGPAGPYL